MGNTKRQNGVLFWLISLVLFGIGLGLRWLHLDSMAFTYDHAAISFRCMEVFEGLFPWTGIVNSLGFRNAPGYVWTLLPAFGFSPDPLFAACWHGFLSATLVFPMALLGRKVRAEGWAWLPAVMAAALPTAVFAGRELWAQQLLPALAGWGLWLLIEALDEQRTDRHRLMFAAGCLAVMTWAVSVHFSAVPQLLIASAALARFLWKQRHAAVRALIPAMAILTTMLPSVADGVRSIAKPLPKHESVRQMEAQLPAVEPVWVRVQQAIADSVEASSEKLVPGIIKYLSDLQLAHLRTLDSLVLVLTIAGLLAAIIRVGSRKSSPQLERKSALVVILWIVVPALIGGLFLSRINPGYFAASLPAAWASVLLFPQLTAAGQRRLMSGTGVCITLLIMGSAAFASSVIVKSIAGQKGLISGYYYPFKLQVGVARQIAERQVAGHNVHHFSGHIFEESYRYLVKYVARGRGRQLALIEDREYLENSPNLLQFLYDAGGEDIGPNIIIFTESRTQAADLMKAYYATPDEPPDSES